MNHSSSPVRAVRVESRGSAVLTTIQQRSRDLARLGLIAVPFASHDQHSAYDTEDAVYVDSTAHLTTLVACALDRSRRLTRILRSIREFEAREALEAMSFEVEEILDAIASRAKPDVDQPTAGER